MQAARALALLSHGDFSRYLWARWFANVAAQMQVVAVGWQVYEVTRQPLDLGLIGLSQFLPFVVLILPAGHAADHFDRRRIVTLCCAFQVLAAGLLCAFTVLDLRAVWPVFGVMSLVGIARAFAMPTGQALLPNLVPREQLSSAVALNSSSFHIATLVGPAAGGLLYIAGPVVVYAVVALLATVGVVLLAGIRQGARAPRAVEPANWETLVSGVRFVFRKPLILGSISLDLFAVLFGGATALLPIFARDVLQVGPTGLGLLRSAPAIGACACALLLALTPIVRHTGRWMFGGVALFGAATIVFGATDHFAVALTALAVLGAADMVSVYIRHLLVQIETPDEIRGRVSAVNAVFIGASNELGEFESGVTAAVFGATRAVIFGGVATLAVSALWIRWFPQLYRMDRFPEMPPSTPRAPETPLSTANT
jgi:MFS family permease